VLKDKEIINYPKILKVHMCQQFDIKKKKSITLSVRENNKDVLHVLCIGYHPFSMHLPTNIYRSEAAY
jgi:hypothetical protein